MIQTAKTSEANSNLFKFDSIILFFSGQNPATALKKTLELSVGESYLSRHQYSSTRVDEQTYLFVKHPWGIVDASESVFVSRELLMETILGAI